LFLNREPEAGIRKASGALGVSGRRRGGDQARCQGLCTLHPAPYTLHTTPCTLYPTHYTLHTAHDTLHPAPYTLHPTPCTLHPTPYTPHPTPCTPHPAHYTPHPTPYTLHTTPFILHPAPCTLLPTDDEEEIQRAVNVLQPILHEKGIELNFLAVKFTARILQYC
jgi:hypothetical protein